MIPLSDVDKYVLKNLLMPVIERHAMGSWYDLLDNEMKKYLLALFKEVEEVDIDSFVEGFLHGTVKKSHVGTVVRFDTYGKDLNTEHLFREGVFMFVEQIPEEVLSEAAALADKIRLCFCPSHEKYYMLGDCEYLDDWTWDLWLKIVFKHIVNEGYTEMITEKVMRWRLP